MEHEIRYTQHKKLNIQKETEERLGAASRKAILIISFGSSIEEARMKGIVPIEQLIEVNFKDYTIARAYTSNFIRAKLAKQGIRIDSPYEALEKLINEGFTEIYVQPLQILAGFEYEKIQAAILALVTPGIIIKAGMPLMTTEEDLESIIEALEPQKERVTIYIGHGTAHPINALYEKLEERLMLEGDFTFVGTLEEGPLPILKRFLRLFDHEGNANHGTKIKLKPFLLVPGDHVINDINGGDGNSWITTFKAKNYDVATDLRGLGEIHEFQQLFLKRVKDLIGEGE